MKFPIKQYAGIFTITDSDTFDELYKRYEETDGKFERLIFVDLRTYPALSIDDLINDLCKKYKELHPADDKKAPRNKI